MSSRPAASGSVAKIAAISRRPDPRPYRWRTHGEDCSELEAIGRPIGPCDLLIAGHARARNLVLVTANSREFSRVEGLDSEDWSIADADRRETVEDR